MLRDALRDFIEKEIKPNLEQLEHGDTPPYDVLRKMFKTFGMDVAARDGFAKRIAFEKEVAEAIAKGKAQKDSQGAQTP